MLYLNTMIKFLSTPMAFNTTGNEKNYMAKLNKTKKEILNEAGYVPVRGRPRQSSEKNKVLGVPLPESLHKKIPEPKAVWVRERIKEAFEQ
jgi:hypothetical protein